MRRAQDRSAREQAQYSATETNQRHLHRGHGAGSSVRLAPHLGQYRGTCGTTAARSAGRIGREHEDVERANESQEVLQQRLTALNAECEQEITALQASVDPQTIAVREVALSARKSDITVGRVSLLWAPWREDADGMPRPAFKV